MTPKIDLSTLSHAEKDELILSLAGQLEAAVARIDELEKRLGIWADWMKQRIREGKTEARKAAAQKSLATFANSRTLARAQESVASVMKMWEAKVAEGVDAE